VPEGPGLGIDIDLSKVVEFEIEYKDISAGS